MANGSLKVKPILREDGGSYICTIRQSRGSDSISEKSQPIIVRVKGKTELSSGKLFIHWLLVSSRNYVTMQINYYSLDKYFQNLLSYPLDVNLSNA